MTLEGDFRIFSLPDTFCGMSLVFLSCREDFHWTGHTCTMYCKSFRWYQGISKDCNSFVLFLVLFVTVLASCSSGWVHYYGPTFSDFFRGGRELVIEGFYIRYSTISRYQHGDTVYIISVTVLDRKSLLSVPFFGFKLFVSFIPDSCFVLTGL